MKCFLSTVLVALMYVVCLGQSKRNNNWAFGDSVGLYFNTALPTVDTNYVLYSLEPSSSISDSSGNLLFYAGALFDGGPPFYYQIKVWNNQRQIMPNGDSLIGGISETQGTLILPTAYDTSLYYVFTIGTASGSSFDRYLYYSIVDMKLDSGRGDVTVKNMQLTTFEMSEKMTAVRHGNGRDWWLITHDSANNFVLFLITPSGVSGPYLQAIGTSLQGSIANQSLRGQICVSSDGSKLCMAGMSKIIDLYDFNRCSGVLDNWVCLGDSLTTGVNQRGIYGCSFSPNSRVMYVSSADTLFQYDLNAANISSTCVILHISSCQDTCWIGQHQIAPNGYIYIANYSSTLYAAYTVYNANISYIENPDVVGFGCGFHYLGQYLNGRISFYSLPNMANYNLGRDTGSVCDSLTGIPHLNTPRGRGLDVVPNPARDETVVSSGALIKHIAILNSRGKIIFERQAAGRSIRINTRDFANGVYVVKVETAEGVAVGKLVVLRK